MSATMGCGHCGPASADEMRPWAQPHDVLSPWEQLAQLATEESKLALDDLSVPFGAS